MANICLIGLNYAPEPIGIGPYSEGWATALAERGHFVRFIAGNPYYPEWKLRRGFSNTFTCSEEQSVDVIRVPHYIPARPGGARRIAHYISFARNAARACKQYPSQEPFDAVIAIAPALLAAPAALRLAKRDKAVSWLHIQDFEVEAALATGLLPDWLSGAGEAVERSIMRRFDRASSIAPGMVKRAQHKLCGETLVEEHRNWAEPLVGSPAADGDAMRAKLGLPQGLIALYSGNLARKQGVGVILEAAKHLQAVEGLHFVVCGEGPAKKEIEQASKHLPNLHSRPLQPRAELANLLDMADIHLMPQIAGAAELMLPSKLPNMLASGRPIVATANKGTSLFDEVDDCGVVVPAGDGGSLSKAVETLVGDAAQRERMGSAARHRAQARWSKATLLSSFCTSLEQAIEAKA